jgi:RND family efflux transporter MFP subunit
MEKANMTSRRTNAGGGSLFAFLIPVIILGVLFMTGLLPRIAGQKELEQAHKETVDAIPTVHTILAKPADTSESLVLPGNIGAIQYTTIYARVDGYLKSRNVDIGDQVKAGQTLAVIETPTIDAQVATAKADVQKAIADLAAAKSEYKEAIAKEAAAKSDVVKAKANNAFAEITAARWIDLCKKGAVSQQSRDEKIRSRDTTTAEVAASESNYNAAIAQVAAAKSNVDAVGAGVTAKKSDLDRTNAKQGFSKVTAPFDGVITLRKVDPGALITEGSGSSNLELFQLARIDRLRIYVSVPQRMARYLKNGMSTDILVPEYPDAKFVGTVTNVSGALDPNTRTRQTEIQIDNKEHQLLPGMYAEVRMIGVRETPWIRVAGTCIVAKPDGQYVVVVKDGKALYQKVSIGRDFGREVEIKTGLTGDEQVIVSPNDDLRDGDPVHAEIASAAQ